LPPEVELRVERELRPLSAVPRERNRAWIERAALFAVAYAVYAGIGLYTTLGLHVVLGDAESRLAHASFVWFNVPHKLSAIGFVWPPLQTLVLLPLAAIRPLATSLAALPLTSAFFGATLVVVLNDALSHARVMRALRWAMVALVGLNPLVLFYATNGMAEIVYLSLLALGVALFVRWARAPRWNDLPLVGLVFALGAMARYEVALWLPIIAAGIVAVSFARRRSAAAVEASIVTIAVPTIYAFLLWIFLNTVITHSPFGFARSDFPGAGGQPGFGRLGSIPSTVWEVFAVSFLVFVPALPLAAGLGAWGVRKRNAVALTLAGALLVNPLTTLGVALNTRLPVALELRYNMRSIPIVLVALAWILGRLNDRQRTHAALAALVALLVAVPVTVVAMTYPVGRDVRSAYTLGERAFLDGLVTGANQDARKAPSGTSLSVHDQREMAHWIRGHIHGRDAILTDDSETYGVMLADGHPDRYFDRIDRGDKKWFAVLRHPVGHVRYVLVGENATRASNVFFYDRIIAQYPQLATGRNVPDLFHQAHRNATYTLYSVRR
jgi:hypothetical protein